MMKNRIERIKYFILAKFRKRRRYLLLLLIPLIFFLIMNVFAPIYLAQNEFISETVVIHMPKYVKLNQFVNSGVNKTLLNNTGNPELQQWFSPIPSWAWFFIFPLVFGFGAMILLRRLVSGLEGFIIGFGVGLTIGVFVNFVSPYILIGYLIITLLYFVYRKRIT